LCLLNANIINFYWEWCIVLATDCMESVWKRNEPFLSVNNAMFESLIDSGKVHVEIPIQNNNLFLFINLFGIVFPLLLKVVYIPFV